MTINDAPDLRGTQADFTQAALPIPGALKLDPADYLPDMAGFDLTEVQKVELLETLWSILRSFVQMGVDVGKADPCGQLFAFVPEFSDASSGDVGSSASGLTETPSNERGKDGAK